MRRRPFAPVALGVATGLLLALAIQPLAAYPKFVAGQLAILVIVTLGVNLLLGVAGLLSLASPAFVGIGANLATMLMIRAGMPIVVAIPLAVLSGYTAGWLLGLVSLRLAGFYLAMVTFGFLNVFLVILNQGGSWTGGGYGLIVPATSLPFAGRLTVNHIVTISVFFAGLLVVLVHVLQRSRIGRAWVAVKDNQTAAELQGIDVARLKTLAFAVSSAIATLAGAFQALLLGVTNPSAYSLNVAISHLTYTVVGGMQASVIGPIVGPLVLFVFPEFFRAIGEWREIFFGSVLLLTLIVAPGGIAGIAIALSRRSARERAGR